MNKLIKFDTRSEFDSFILSNSGLGNIEEALSATNNGVYNCVVYIIDTGEIYANNKITAPGGSLNNPEYALKTELDYKVDKIEGMGLSTNDYTTEEKTKLSGLENYNDSGVLSAISGKQDTISDLDTIRSGAALGATASQTDNITYQIVNHGTSDTTFTITPNHFHVWDEITSLTLTLGAEESDVMNEYLFQFTSGSTATTLNVPDSIAWVSEPSIEANNVYQASIVNNIGIIASVATM